MPTRASHLPIVQYCPKAVELDLGAGRAAAQSTAYHAWCAASPEADQLIALLSDSEREELRSWARPTPFTWNHHVIDYADAQVEQALGITADGDPCDHDDPCALIKGHDDMDWVVQVGAQRVVVVGDIKRTLFTSTADSLQIHAYGHMLAAKYGCDAYLPVLWIPTEGEWVIGKLVDLTSREALAIWRKLVFAANNKSDQFATGSHCDGCWSRLRCPAHLVQLSYDTLAVPGTMTDTPSPSEVRQLLLDYYRHANTLKAVKGWLDAYADQNNGIEDGNGKVWKAVSMPGREGTVSPAKLREALGDQAEQYIHRGAGFSQHRWVNAK